MCNIEWIVLCFISLHDSQYTFIKSLCGFHLSSLQLLYKVKNLFQKNADLPIVNHQV